MVQQLQLLDRVETGTRESSLSGIQQSGNLQADQSPNKPVTSQLVQHIGGPADALTDHLPQGNSLQLPDRDEAGA